MSIFGAQRFTRPCPPAAQVASTPSAPSRASSRSSRTQPVVQYTDDRRSPQLGQRPAADVVKRREQAAARVAARASNVAEAAAAAAAATPKDKGKGHRTTPGGSKRKHQTAGATTGGSGRSPKARAAGGASTGRKRPALRSEEEDSSEEEDEGEHEDDAHAMEEAEDESDEDEWKEVKVDIKVGTDFTSQTFQSEMLIMRKLDDLLSDDDDEGNEQLSANCTGDDISTELLARSYPDIYVYACVHNLITGRSLSCCAAAPTPCAVAQTRGSGEEPRQHHAGELRSMIHDRQPGLRHAQAHADMDQPVGTRLVHMYIHTYIHS